MEQIQTHPLQDIYRMEHGVLLIVNKYESHGTVYDSDLKKIKHKKVSGISKTYQLLEETQVRHWQRGMQTLPVGTFVMQTTVASVLTDPKEFRAELKLSGGTYAGDISEHLKFYQSIERILAKYGA